MNIPKTIADEFGRNRFKPLLRSSFSLNWLPASLIFIFIIVAFLGDMHPCKTVSETYAYVYPENVRALAMDFDLRPEMWFSFGSAAQYFNSFLYVALIKLFYLFIPYRLLCMRVISVFSAALSMFFLYRLTVILFCRQVGILLLFILATSSSYLENMRAFGYIPLTNLIVCLIGYLLSLSLNGRGVVLKCFLLSLFSYLMFSLYVLGRLIILLPVIIFALHLKKYWKQIVIFLAMLAVLVVASNRIFGGRRLNLNQLVFINSEWLLPSSPKCPIDEDVLWGRFKNNLKYVSRYLSFQHSDIYYEADDIWIKTQALINICLTPFFLFGLLACLWRRKTSNIFLLAWLFFLFIIPMFSSWLPLRRVTLALSPIHLLIALGLWFVFRLFTVTIPAVSQSRVFKGVCVLFVLGVGCYNLYTFFSRASRPEYNYTGPQLRRLAEAISEKGKNVRSLRFNMESEDLIWGNPYFDSKFIDINVVGRMEFEGIEFERANQNLHQQDRSAEEAKDNPSRLLHVITLLEYSSLT